MTTVYILWLQGQQRSCNYIVGKGLERPQTFNDIPPRVIAFSKDTNGIFDLHGWIFFDASLEFSFNQRRVCVVQKIFERIARLGESLVEYTCQRRHSRMIVTFMRTQLPERGIQRVRQVWVGLVSHEVVFEMLPRLLIAVDHTHQRGVALKDVINEWDGDYDTGGWCGERQARKTLYKRCKQRRGQMRGTQKQFREAEKPAPIFKVQEILVKEGV